MRDEENIAKQPCSRRRGDAKRKPDRAQPQDAKRKPDRAQPQEKFGEIFS
jgi:hypothetical protein